MKKVKLYLGIPTMGMMVDSLVYMLRELEDRYSDKIEFVYPEQLVHRIFHDSARNHIVEDFLETDCDVLWFIDADVTPPKHTPDLITMYWDKWEVSGAPYPVFMSQPGETERQIVFTAYKGSNGKGLCPTKIPYSGQEYVDGLATGCMFIKRAIFDKLEKPYFEFKYNPTTRALTEGEDLGFCLKMASLGIKFFTDYSMVCRHKKDIDLLEFNNYAISYAQKAVDMYHESTKQQVKQLETMIREKYMKPPQSKSGLILPGR